MISVYKDFDNPPKDLLGDNPQITDAVKRELWELYHGKCAFSEEKISFEEMEVAHYRPVKAYPELEFEWSNLLPVSGRVNGLLANNFPMQGEKVNSELLKNRENRKADSECLLAEKSVLLHPEVDTPENHFIVVGLEFVGITQRGIDTINFLDLNYKNELSIEHRAKQERLQTDIRIERDKLKTALREKYANLPKDEISKKITNSTVEEYSSIMNPYFLTLYSFFEVNKPYSLFCKLSIDYLIREITSVIQTEESATIDSKIREILRIGYKNFTPKPYLKNENWKEVNTPIFARLEIRNLYSIKKLELPEFPINNRWIFLTGENGAGKSLILQAIALGFLNHKYDFASLNENTRIVLDLVNTRDTPRRLVLDNNIHYATTKPFQQFAAYGPSRLSVKESYTNKDKEEEKLYSVFQHSLESNKLENIESYLCQLHVHPNVDFKKLSQEIIKLLEDLLPNLKIEFDSSRVEIEVVYREKMDNDSLSSPLSFSQLSAGSKSIIAMIGDMVIRLLSSQSVNILSDFEGIILIDEIDIHLHAKWQKQFVETLTRLFPKIQFIASTHSPIPLLGAPKETVILNVEKPSKKEGITVRRLDIDVTTLTPNTILTSPIFGFEELNSVENKDKKRIYTQENYDDVLFEQKLKENLKKLVNEDDLSKYIIKGDKNG